MDSIFLRGFDVFVVSPHLHHARTLLPWARKIANSWVTEDMDLHKLALPRASQSQHRLDDEWIGQLEIQVHDCNQAQANDLAFYKSYQLSAVVIVNGSWRFRLRQWSCIYVKGRSVLIS